MHRLARSAFAAVALLLLGAPRLAAPDAKTITILSVGDTHSHLDATGPKDVLLRGTVGGLAKAASVIGKVRTTTPNTVLVHAGDLFNGDLYFVATQRPGGPPLLSVAELQLLADLGLDVMTVGNHELALGTETLASVLSAAFGSMPWDRAPSVLSANLDLGQIPALEKLVAPRVIKDVDGVKVGFFGLTVVDFLSAQVPFLEASFSLEGLVGLATQEAITLRSQGAEVVVCLAHLGRALEEAIAANAPVDAVIGAHDHVALADAVPTSLAKRVPLVKSGEFYENVGKITLTIDDGLVTGTSELISVGAKVARAPQVYEEVRYLQLAIDLRYGEPFWRVPIAFAPADLSKEADPASEDRDSAVANLITDALRSAGRTDMGLTVNGLLPDGLTHGFLVREDAFRIVGDGIDPEGAVIGFPLYRIKLSGANFLAALETSLSLNDGGDLFVQGSGLSYEFDGSLPAFSKVQWVKIGGQPLFFDKIYSATVNLGVLEGLKKFNVQLATPEERLRVGEYAAVRDWMKHLGIVYYTPEGRIIDVSKKR